MRAICTAACRLSDNHNPIFGAPLLSFMSSELRSCQPPGSSLGHVRRNASTSSTMTTITRNLPWFIRDLGVSIVGQVCSHCIIVFRMPNSLPGMLHVTR